jgi:WD40 repeat protein
MGPSDSDRNPVEELAEEFVARYRRGERPSLEEYTDRYPAWAEQIRALFPALVVMEKVRPGPEEGVERSGGVRAGEARLERLGDYRILREVGRGGMGVVYEAEQESLGRHVALKVLGPQAVLDPRHLVRFLREAKAAARLHHTNIVPVHGVGEQDGVHYYVMQFIQGLGLDEVLHELKRLRHARRAPPPGPATGDKELSAVAVAQALLTGKFEAGDLDQSEAGPGVAVEAQSADGSSAAREAPPAPTEAGPSSAIHLPGQSRGAALSESGWQYWRSVARIGLQVADALAHASSQGILHRDIKPSNLLLDTRGTVWVTDFGLAKADTDHDDVTHTGDIVGTLRYMAPERFQGHADVRSDVYALGLTLYELLTLRPAFHEADRNKLIAEVMHGQPPRPRNLDTSVPRDLETIVLKATAREPAQRYQAPAEVAEDLQCFLDDRPIKARRTTLWEHAWRWCWRNPLVAGLMAAVALLLIAVAATAMFGYLQTAAALDQAQRDRAGAITNQYHSLVREARAIRLARAHGYRVQAWRVLEQALRLETPERDVEALRREAVACLGDFVGLEPTVWSDFPASVQTIAIHPDGTQVVIGLADGTICLRNLITGAELLRSRWHSARIRALTFAPGGKALISGDHEGTIKVCEPDATGTWACVRTLKMDQPAQYLAVAPNGRQLLASCFDAAKVTVWDLPDGTPAEGYSGQGKQLGHIAINPDGKLLAGRTYRDGAHGILIWDLASKQVRKAISSPVDEVNGLEFSADSRFLACACDSGVVLFEMAELKERALPGEVSGSVRFSPDGGTLAFSCVQAGEVKLWNLHTNRQVASLPVPDILEGPRALALTGDGKALVAAAPGSVRVCNIGSTVEKRVLPGHTGRIGGLAFSPDGRLLVSASQDQTARVWDVTTGELLTTLTGFRGPLGSVAFSPDGRVLATADWSGAIRLWHTSSWREAQELPHELGKVIWWVAFSPNGAYFAACGSGLTLWSVRPETTDERNGPRLQFQRIARPSQAYPITLGFNPTSDLLAWVDSEYSLHLWDLTKAGPCPFPPTQVAGKFGSLAFCPDGQRLLFISTTGEVEVWHVPSRQRTFSFGRGYLERHGYQGLVALSGDGRWLATLARPSEITLWDTTNGRMMVALPAERSAVAPVVWGRNRDLLAVGLADGGLVVWNLPQVRSQLAQIGLDW